MIIQNLDIGLIKPYKKNAKTHSEKQIDQVAGSIKQFGWAQPLVVDSENNLVIGHCRLLAAKKLGLHEVPVIQMDNLDKKQIKALRLADNKLNESTWDMDLAQAELKELVSEDFDIAVTGFSLVEETEEIEEDFQAKKYCVTVEAKNDLDAKNIYEKLTEMGFDCRINK
jgi:ParB-like chromosome segregation protein Spo0J